MKYEFFPEPTKCDVCKSTVFYFEHEQKFKNMRNPRIIGMWKCKSINCRALVSCHPGTRNPVGFMAQESVRKLRSAAHKEFDKLWTKSYSQWSRHSAYLWLSELLKIPKSMANISKLDSEQLETLIRESKIMSTHHKKLETEFEKGFRQGFSDRILKKTIAKKDKVKIDKRNYEKFI